RIDPDGRRSKEEDYRGRDQSHGRDWLLMLELRQITKRFGEVLANDHVDIVGENGAGKSTAMRIAYGFYTADSGEILVDGQVRDIKSPHDAIALGIGMVHQHFMLVETMTVAENIVLGA